MRYRSIVLFLTLFGAVTAFAQAPPPVIQTVTPSRGPVAGGSHVTLTGIALNPSCGAYLIACPEPQVRIGGRLATIISRSHDQLVVIAPPHSNGLADVEVRTAGGTHTLPRAFAYGATDFRRLLLPVYIDGVVEGAEGSRWVTELSGFHRQTDVARVTGDPETSAGTVAGRTAFTPAVSTERPGLGRFIYVAEENAAAVILNLRARDVSREAENLGTEIPVVSADQTFVSGSDIALVNIPTQEQYRQKIRIYDFDGELERVVTVRVYGDDMSNPLATRELTLTAGELDHDYPPYPGQADLDLNLLPELAGVPRVTVIVETPDEGRWWAFASITNNATQLITTVTP
ncbi:MAG TPA: IPT/TIG domain-containing protein [Thermoanaerobaculia bacterium]|nr:IPT/TIG domain-containing protein [Thermoanaerobaculia bacterium]